MISEKLKRRPTLFEVSIHFMTKATTSRGAARKVQRTIDVLATVHDGGGVLTLSVGPRKRIPMFLQGGEKGR